MEQAKKNQYSRNELTPAGPGGSVFITPRPLPTAVAPFNPYTSYFAVQHVKGDPYSPAWDRKCIMISGSPVNSDWAGVVKLPGGKTIKFEAVDQLEYGDGIQYIVLRLNMKTSELEALAVKDYKSVPKGYMQRCLAIIDDDHVEQIAHCNLIDFTVSEDQLPENPFQSLENE